ncbi:hypothetical protein BJP37_31995, partial [Moorena bouillonii PNG]
MGLLGCLLLITIALQLYAPIILGQFIDDARAGAPLNGLYLMALGFIGLIAVAQLFSVMTSYQAEIVGWTATNALRSDLTRHILNLDLRFHNRYTAGELIERVDGDVGTLHQFFALLVVRIIGNALLLIGLLIVLFWQDSLIGLGVLAFVIVIAIIFYRIRHLAVEAIIKDRQATADLGGFWEEHLLATEDLRSNGAVDYVLNQQGPLHWQVLQATRKARFLGWSMHGSYIALHIFGYALIFVLGGYLYLQGDVTLGTVYLVFHYLGLVVVNLRAFVRELDTLQRARASLSRIRGLLREKSLLGTRDETGYAAISPAYLQFTDVAFAYGEQPVLQGVTFGLQKGERMALLGRTGSGKSTIARLLFRFYDPQVGQIRLGGEPLQGLPLSGLRRRI